MKKHNSDGKAERSMYLGLDVGGTFIKWGLVRDDGEMLLNGSEPTPAEGITEFYGAIKRIIDKARSEMDFDGIGLCSPGIVDSRNGVVIGGTPNIPYLLNERIQTDIESISGVPVRILNDVNAVLIGEKWVKGFDEFKNIVCITVGTGIGGSFMLDGAIYEGAHYRSFEIGYMDYEGEREFFEKKNCAKALIMKAREKLSDTSLSEDEFFKLVAAGDSVACQIYGTWIDGLSKKIADIILTLDPELIIIGGGITERKDLLLIPLKTAVNKYLPPDFQNIVEIKLASCGNKAGILGAVKNFMNRIKE